MITLDIPEADVIKLDQLRRAHASPLVRRRAEAVYLKAKGLQHHDIVRVCGISRMTLTTYLHHYAQGGLSARTKTQYRGQASALNAWSDPLTSYFRTNPPQTVAEAQAAIAEQTGIERSATQVRAFLHRLGLALRTTASIPAKATNPDKQLEQATFQREQLEPRLAEVRAGKRSLFL